MIFKGFQIAASPFLHDAICPKCRQEMEEVDDSIFSKGLFCYICEEFYTLKLSKVNKKNVNKEYLKKCIEEFKEKKRIYNLKRKK